MTTRTAEKLFTDRALAKAHALVDQGAIVNARSLNVFFVPASDGVVHYRVTIDYDGPAAVSAHCTCPHGQHRIHPYQPLCYHATACLLYVLQARREGGTMSALLDITEA